MIPDVYPGSRILDPDFFHPGSRRGKKKALDPGSRSAKTFFSSILAFLDLDPDTGSESAPGKLMLRKVKKK
jgi:hypothetical protein